MRTLRLVLAVAILLAIPASASSVDQLLEDRAARFREEKQRAQDERHAALLPVFLTSAARAKIVHLWQGLPHPSADPALHAAEKSRVSAIELHGQWFYPKAVTPLRADSDQLRYLLARPASYQSYGGPKLCGGFHADYAIEWRDADRVFRALVCFGCHEIRLVSADADLLCDLPTPAYEELSRLLRPHRPGHPAP